MSGVLNADTMPQSGSPLFFLRDSVALDSARAAIDTFLLHRIPEGHIVAQVIHADIDGDHIDDLVIGSSSVLLMDPTSYSSQVDAEVRSVMVYRGTATGYEQLWADMETSFENIKLISFRGQKHKTIVLSSRYCYMECSGEISFYMQGSKSVPERFQMLPRN